jgi:nucleoside-triphosphatase
VGFEVADLDSGAKGWLAHVNQHEGPKVGKYKVNLADFELVGVKAVQNAIERTQVVIIDEIGPMELASNTFTQVVKDALDSKKPILGVIHRNARDAIVEATKLREDIEILTITFENRRNLHKALIDRAVQYLNQGKTVG